MALNLGELLVKIGVDVAGLESGMKSAQKSLMNFGMNAEMAGMALSKTLTLPLTLLGGAALKTSIDFESAFAGVRKTVNATEKEFSQLETEIRDMAKRMPAAATEIAGVGEAAGQLGIKTKAISQFSEVMVKLGVSTNLSARDAATALARLANITQMPQDQFDRLGATVVHLGNNLATTEAEIVQMGLRLAGAGKQVGLTEAQILGFAGALSAVGIEAEAGGTAMSRAFIKIAEAVMSGGEQLDTFAAISGQSAAQFKQSFERDAAGAVISFVEGLGHISKAGGNVFAALEQVELGEIRVRDALLRASGAGHLFREALEMGTVAFRENVALNKEAEQRFATTASQLKIMWNQVKDVAITLGESLKPALLGSLQALEPMLKSVERGVLAFNELDRSTQKMVFQIAAGIAVLGPATLAIGLMAQSASALIPMIKGVGAAFGLLATGGLAIAAFSARSVFAFQAVTVGVATFREAVVYAVPGIAKLGAAFAAITGPVGLVVAGIAAVTAALVSQEVQTRRSVSAEIDRSKNFGDLLSKYDKLEDSIQRSKAAGGETSIMLAEQTRIVQELTRLMPDLSTSVDVHTGALTINTSEIRTNKQALLEQARAKLADLEATELSINSMQKLSQVPVPDIKFDTRTLRAEIAALEHDLVELDKTIENQRDRAKGSVAALLLGPDWESDTREAGRIAQETMAQIKAEALVFTGDSKAKEFLDAFSRAQDDVMRAFKRTQEDQLIVFRETQAGQRKELEKSLDEQRNQHDRYVDDLRYAFQREQEAARQAKQDELDTSRRLFQQSLDKERDSFKESQSAILRDLRETQDQQRDIRQQSHLEYLAQQDAELAAALAPLKARQDQIRQTEELEQQAERQADLVKRIAKAQEELNKVRMKGTPEEIRNAQERLTDALRDQAKQQLADQRKAELDSLRQQMDALTKQTEDRKRAIDKQFAIEQKMFADNQAAEMDALQRQLKTEEKAYSDQLAERQRAHDKTLQLQMQAFQRQQDEQNRAKSVELDGLRKAETERLDLIREAISKQQSIQIQAFQRQQDDAANTYGRELEDRKKSFAKNLDAQKTFIDQYKNNINQLKGVTPPVVDIQPVLDDTLGKLKTYVGQWNRTVGGMATPIPGGTPTGAPSRPSWFEGAAQAPDAGAKLPGQVTAAEIPGLLLQAVQRRDVSLAKGFLQMAPYNLDEAAAENQARALIFGQQSTTPSVPTLPTPQSSIPQFRVDESAGKLSGIAPWEDQLKGAAIAANLGQFDKAASILGAALGLEFQDAMEIVKKMPKVPQLAEGGLVKRPTLAMLGERGAEAILPLGRLGEILSSVAGRIMHSVIPGGLADSRELALSDSGTLEANFNIELNMGYDKVLDVVQKALVTLSRQGRISKTVFPG